MTTIKGVFYTKEQYDALVAERDEARKACEKAIRERRSLEIKEDDWHSAYERSLAEVARLREALRGKCDCGHIHDRDNGCDDCSCWGWSCAALGEDA